MESIFVGRDKEINQILSVWNSILTKSINAPRIAFIEGEAGVGKSSLVNHVIHEIKSKLAIDNSGILIGSGYCEVFEEAQIAYLPFYQILDKLKASIPLQSKLAKLNQFNRIVQEIAPGWFKMLPVIGEPIADTLKGAAELKKQADEKRNFLPSKQLDIDIYAQYVKILEGLFNHSKQPILIHIDDIQWADQESIHLLAYLGQYLPKTSIPILLIGCYRSESKKPDSSHESTLTSMLTRLKQRNLSNTLTLSPFSNEETSEYIERAYTNNKSQKTAGFPTKVRETLQIQTGGNPLFLSEILSALEERGLIQKISGEWKLKESGDILDNLPNNLQATLEERINRLEKRLREILTVASVEGENFTVQVVARINNSEFTDVLDLLVRELARNYGLVKELEEKEIAFRKYLTLYAFHHGLIRKFVYQSLSNAQKRIFHQQVADCLEDLYGLAYSETIAVQLARHYWIAKDYPQIIKYGIKAAQQEFSKNAPNQAIWWCENAVEILNRFPDIPNQEENRKLFLSAQLIRIEAYEQIGKNQEALQVANNSEMYWLSGTLTHAYFEYWRGILLERLGQSDEALKSLDAALKIFVEHKQLQWQALCLYRIGHVNIDRGFTNIAYQQLADAIQIAKQLGNNLIEALALSEIGMAATEEGNLSKAESSSLEALRIFRDLKIIKGEAFCLRDLSDAEYVRGNLAKSETLVRRALELAKEAQDENHIVWCMVDLARCLVDRGKLDEAEAVAMESINRSEEMGDTGFYPEACISLTLVAIDRNDFDSATKHITKGMEIVTDDDYWSWTRVYYTMGEVLISRGQVEQAEMWIERAYQKAITSGGKLTQAYAQYAFARYLYLTKRDELASKIVGLCKQNLSEIGVRLMHDKTENLELGILEALQNKDAPRKLFPRGN